MALALTGSALAFAGAPAAALADGPIAPTGTNFYARVTHAPAGIDAQVVDGYLNLYVKVAPSARVTILDFRGAPWVRFSPRGVAINTRSQEYYLSQIPVPAVPPAGLTARTPPRWIRVSGGHAYQWREGRLHALATIALAPGQRFIGSWRIPAIVNGRRVSISGGLWHRGAPSIVWFWPILVLLACALAAWRLRSGALDRRLTTALAPALLVLAIVGMAAKYLHGSPGVSPGNLVLLALTIVVFGGLAWRVARGHAGWPLLAAAVLTAWVGVTLLPVLTHGYALVSLPLPLVRAITAALLGGALALTPFAVRSLDLHAP